MPRTKKPHLFLTVGMLIAVVAGYGIWLYSESQNVRWVVDLVGGEASLSGSGYIQSDEDSLYIKSLYLSPDEQMYDSVRALKLCQEINEKCLTISLTVANFLLINTTDVQAARNVVQGYARYNILQAQPCPAKYETSQVIKDTQYLSTLPPGEAKRFAEDQLARIETSGGLIFSLRTPECRGYFAAHPYVARGYLAHMALLVKAAQGTTSAAWLYLLSRPGVYAIIK